MALGLIFAPQTFGVDAVPADASPALIAFLRLWGSPLLGIAVLDWMARKAEPSAARDAVIVGNIVGFAAIGLIDVWGALSGGRPAHQLFAVVHLLFAVVFLVVGRRNFSTGRDARRPAASRPD